MTDVTTIVNTLRAEKITKDELNESLKCLSAGLPPSNTIVLREIWEFRSALDAVLKDEELLLNNKKGVFRIVQGPIGSGKTFILKVAELRIKHNKGVVSRIDLSNTAGLASKQALLSMMSAVIYGFSTKTSSSLKGVLNEASLKFKEKGIISEDELMNALEPLTNITKGTDFRRVISKYLRGDLDNDKKDLAFKWLTLESKAKVDLKKAFGIDQYFTEADFSKIITIWSKFFKIAGFEGGTLVILDELAEAYSSLTKSKVEICNKLIFELLNELFSGSSHSAGLGVYIGATEQTVIDEKFGFYAHEALKSRLQELSETKSGNERAVTSNPVIRLKKLSENATIRVLQKVGAIAEMADDYTKVFDTPVVELIEKKASYVYKTWAPTRSLRDLIKLMIELDT